jgi:hypothetical protein
MALYANTIFTNGNVVTLDDANFVAQALAVHDGKIIFVGSDVDVEVFSGESTEHVDLNGSTMLPGFIDAHTHLLRTGMELTLYEDLDTPSLDGMLQKIEAAASQRDSGQWVVGRGWDESGWPEARYPTKEDLDRIAPNHPAVLIRVCGHIVVVNSKALEAVEVKDDPATVDRDKGWLREESAWGFLDKIDPPLDERVKALKAGIAYAHQCGITSIHDIVDDVAIETYNTLRKREGLSLRVRMNVVHHYIDSLIKVGIQGEFGDDFLRLGALKLFADGSLGARNAALMSPYTDDLSTDGQLNHTQDDLVMWMKKGHEHGFQLMTHAIGDRAIEAVLDAYQAVGVEPADRARIEHLEMPTADQLKRMAASGVIASMQANFVQWSGPGKLYEQRLGAARDAAIDPHRKVLEADVSLVFSSDSMPVNVLHGLHQTVNAPHDGQRLTALEALRAYTQGGAFAGFSETQFGKLSKNMQADLVVLNQDPQKVPDAIEDITVEQTYVSGQRVY